jgi:hypothetical protein
MENSLAQRFAIFLALVLIMNLSGCSMSGDERPQAAPQPRLVDLFYATDRAADADGDGYFSGIRGDLS